MIEEIFLGFGLREVWLMVPNAQCKISLQIFQSQKTCQIKWL